MLIILWIKLLPKSRVVHLFDLVHLLPALIKRYKDRLLVIIWPKWGICLYNGIDGGLSLRHVVDDIMDLELPVLVLELEVLLVNADAHLKVRQGRHEE
jgi:hypothetical protein